ncbi:MAG: extracellular solute-binding protein [Clostridia bacterium]|nr:extracellular solute-binding protein [Clostridia bacterium]
MRIKKFCRPIRMISALTVLLFVISLFAACSDDSAPSSSRQQTSSASQTQSSSSSQQENVSSEPSDDPEDYDGHPYLAEKVDLNGLEVIFAVPNDLVIPKDDSTEINGEILDSLRRIQKDYNCRISSMQIEYGDWDDIISALAAGEEYADVLLPCIHQTADFFEANICADFTSPEISRYIDMSRPWWNDSVMQAANVGGKVYAAAPCISDTIGVASVVLFDKDVLEDIGHESDELYSLYHKGEWTWDALAKYAKKANKDLDKDGKLNGFDDRCGLVGSGYNTARAFSATAGVSVFAVENGKNAVYSLNTEHAIKTLERLNSFFNTEDIFCDTSWDSTTRRDVVMFKDDLALFSFTWFLNLDSFSKNKAGRVGVLPLPLGPDENGGWQKEYVSLGDHNFRVALIPKTVKDKEGTALVLEALAFDRWKLMYGKLDRVLESIEADEQTAQIARDIYGYVTFEADQFLYTYEQYKWNTLTSGIFRGIVRQKDYDVKGLVNARAKEAQALLNKYYGNS